jgi:hypothetical protein
MQQIAQIDNDFFSPRISLIFTNSIRCENLNASRIKKSFLML